MTLVRRNTKLVDRIFRSFRNLNNINWFNVERKAWEAWIYNRMLHENYVKLWKWTRLYQTVLFLYYTGTFRTLGSLNLARFAARKSNTNESLLRWPSGSTHSFVLGLLQNFLSTCGPLFQVSTHWWKKVQSTWFPICDV